MAKFKVTFDTVRKIAGTLAGTEEATAYGSPSIKVNGTLMAGIPVNKAGSCWARWRNYTWAELMKRVWAIDVLECPRCFGRMRLVAAIRGSL